MTTSSSSSILLACGAAHLSARPNLRGFTWKPVGRARQSAPGGRSDWMGGGRRAAASLPKPAGTVGAAPRSTAGCSSAPFIIGVRLFLRGAQESSALQLCNEPLPFFLFLGSEFLFSSSSTSKKRIFNNSDRKSLLSRSDGW